MFAFVLVVIIIVACTFLFGFFRAALKRNKFIQIEVKQRALLTNSRFGKDTDRALYQALESLYIVDTSSNISTVKSRLPFLHDVLVSFEYVSKNVSHWPEIVNKVEMAYNEAYNNRHVYPAQREVILSPSEILDNWGSFAENMLFETAVRYVEGQEKFIVPLKTTSAKNKRYIKIAEEIEDLLSQTGDTNLKERYLELQQEVLSKA